ncbi:MAG: 50S ribosomal protein L29 [Candidatus Omnitrophota bacterium]
MKISEIQKFSNDEINGLILEKQKNLVTMKFQLVASQLKDVKAIGKTKKDIARLLTALKSKG